MSLDTFIAAISAGIAAAALLKGAYDQNQGIKREKKQATLDAYNKLQAEVFDVVNGFEPRKIREAYENRDREIITTMDSALARVEHFCVGLETGIYDFDTFYSLSHGYFDQWDDGRKRGKLYNRLLPVLEVKSADPKEDYYQNLHAVWMKMEKRSAGN